VILVGRNPRTHRGKTTRFVRENGPTLGDDATSVTSRRVRKRVLPGVSIALVLVAGGGLAYFLAADTDNLGDRPPEAVRPTTWFTLAPLEPGASFSLGTPRIGASGKPIEVLEVAPRYSANLEYVGAIAIWPRDLAGPGIDVAASYPPQGQSRYHPAIGAPVPVAELSFVPTGYDSAPPLGITPVSGSSQETLAQ
jgi:hypothetical protein